jgi:hypothetical protein
MSKIAKFGCEMLYNAENIALQNSQILYTFVLRAEITTTFRPKLAAISVRRQYKSTYTKFTNFARLYFPHIRTFRNQTFQFYSF